MATLDELTRLIKVNSKGIKRIKMQCPPGMKWNGSHCEVITGEEKAIRRRAIRQAILNKKSQGQSLKIKTVRKMRKADRFRKSFGLKV